MIIFDAKGRSARCVVTEAITTGSVGLSVDFRFDKSWDGLAKIATFVGSNRSADVMIGESNTVPVPPQCLTAAGGLLVIGVRGARPDGMIVMPTVLARAGLIELGSLPCGVDPQSPAPDWAAQVQAEAAEALAKAAEVEAAAARGDFDGFSPAFTVADIPGGHRITITDADHPEGQSFDVLDGQDSEGGQEIFWATYGSTSAITILGKINRSVLVLCEYDGYVYRCVRSMYSGGVSTGQVMAVFHCLANGYSKTLIVTDTWHPAGRDNAVWTSSGVQYVSVDSPSLIGTPTAPTAPVGTNTTQIATTAFVQAALSGAGTAGAVDAALDTESENAVQNQAVAQAIQALQEQIDDLNYTPIAVSGFSVSPNQAEMGSSVTTVSLIWALNRAAFESRLDGEVIALTSTSGTISRSGLSLTANKTWTLTATDERGATASRSASLSFLNRVYWGAAAEPETLGSAFVLSLASSALASSRGRTITLSAGTGQYIWYCIPARLGTPAFKVGGFDGGFTLVGTLQHTNASGYTESYSIYRSDNAALGQTTVTIS